MLCWNIVRDLPSHQMLVLKDTKGPVTGSWPQKTCKVSLPSLLGAEARNEYREHLFSWYNKSKEVLAIPPRDCLSGKAIQTVAVWAKVSAPGCCCCRHLGKLQQSSLTAGMPADFNFLGVLLLSLFKVFHSLIAKKANCLGSQAFVTNVKMFYLSFAISYY